MDDTCQLLIACQVMIITCQVTDHKVTSRMKMRPPLDHRRVIGRPTVGSYGVGHREAY